MNDRIIITGTDEKYYPLVIELFNSIKANQKSNGISLGVIDAGITAFQKKELIETYGCIVRSFSPEQTYLQKAITKRPALAVNLGKLWLDLDLPG